MVMLGIGPLFFALMSETFGRRKVFLTNLTLFTLVQIPTALAPNVTSFIVLRVLGGLCGSVGVANGGGSISDMFETHERAAVLGVYLLGPLLGSLLVQRCKCLLTKVQVHHLVLFLEGCYWRIFNGDGYLVFFALSALWSRPHPSSCFTKLMLR